MCWTSFSAFDTMATVLFSNIRDDARQRKQDSYSPFHTNDRGTPQNSWTYNLPKTVYGTWNEDRLMAVLKCVPKCMQDQRNSGFQLTNQERYRFLVEFEIVMEQLVDRFDVDFKWHEGELLAKDQGGRVIRFDASVSEMFYLDFLAQYVGGTGDLLRSVTYGTRCVQCVLRLYKYVGLTSGSSLIMHAMDHFFRTASKSRISS